MYRSESYPVHPITQSIWPANRQDAARDFQMPPPACWAMAPGWRARGPVGVPVVFPWAASLPSCPCCPWRGFLPRRSLRVSVGWGWLPGAGTWRAGTVTVVPCGAGMGGAVSGRDGGTVAGTLSCCPWGCGCRTRLPSRCFCSSSAG